MNPSLTIAKLRTRIIMRGFLLYFAGHGFVGISSTGRGQDFTRESKSLFGEATVLYTPDVIRKVQSSG